jgi:ABC-type antimicrobial peptide transport system permease subunit
MLVLGMGLFLLLYLRLKKETRQIAVLRAIGFGKDELERYMLIDLLSLITIGLLFGGFVSGIFVWIGFRYIVFFMGFPPDLWSISLPMEIIFPPIPILILAIVTIIVTVLIGYIMQKRFLASRLFLEAKLDIE